MRKFYAENDTRMGDGSGSVDLWRFDSKKERDKFVENRDHANVITRKKAEKAHKGQFKYWQRNG